MPAVAKLKPIWTVLNRSLRENERDILTHIAAMRALKRSGGIESRFAKSFLDCLGARFETEIRTATLGTSNYFGSRPSGRVDCFIPEVGLAIEFKVGRLPRKAGNELFDISQVAADVLRMRAASVAYAYLIVFVYGPLVQDADSKLSLYKAFHNAYFVDYSAAKARAGTAPIWSNEHYHAHMTRARALGWHKPWVDRKLPSNCLVFKTENVGAICLDCLPGTSIPKRLAYSDP
jgi:hypothetical protein